MIVFISPEKVAPITRDNSIDAFQNAKEYFVYSNVVGGDTGYWKDQQKVRQDIYT
jgi:hypothetical protein